MMKATTTKKNKTLEAVTAANPILNPAFIAYWMKRQGKFSLIPRPSAPRPIRKFFDGAWCGGSEDETGDN